MYPGRSVPSVRASPAMFKARSHPTELSADRSRSAWATIAPEGAWFSTCGGPIVEGTPCLRTAKAEFHHRGCAEEVA